MYKCCPPPPLPPLPLPHSPAAVGSVLGRREFSLFKFSPHRTHTAHIVFQSSAEQSSAAQQAPRKRARG